MLSERALLMIVTETPLHPGGGTSLGAVDLPIQRERHTQYPMVQASGVKGALRDLAYSAKKVDAQQRRDFDRAARKKETDALGMNQSISESAETILSLEAVFGPETDRADAHAGALAFTDARLLLFPVRSLQGLFAWVTSPFALARFERDLRRAGIGVPWSVPQMKDEEALTGTKSTVRVETANQVVLEEYSFIAPTEDRSQAVDRIAEHLAARMELFGPSDGAHAYWRGRLWDSEAGTTNLVVLSDTAFRDFVLFSTEVISRIRVDSETGTVASGALWSEEHLPSDTVLYSLVLADAPRGARTGTVHSAASVMGFLRSVIDDRQVSVIQLGGDETVGRGFVSMHLCHGSDVKEGKA